MNPIKKALQKVKGEVYTDRPTLYCYSTDASIYQIQPAAVVCPTKASDVSECITAAKRLRMPVTARAAGTNLAGSCLGRGIILDVSKNMDRIIGVREDDRGQFFVDVEPGVIINDLQAYLKTKGLFLPHDPSSSEICMIGGNLGTKASGARAVKYGTIDDYIESVEFVTAEGEIIDTASEDTIPDRIRTGISELLERLLADAATIARLESKRAVKTASGYNMRALLDHDRIGCMIAHLMSGSVGTLGIFTRIRLKVLPIVSGTAISAIYFKSLSDAGDAVQHIRKLGPVKIEMMDATSLGIVRGEYPDLEILEDASALFVEFEGDSRKSKIRDLEWMIHERYDVHWIFSESDDQELQEGIWAVRKALVPILTNYDEKIKPDAFIDDVAVAIPDLAPLIGDLHEIFDRYHLTAAIYGHAGSGNLHIRPMLNLNDPANIKLLPELADRIFDLRLSPSNSTKSALASSRIYIKYPIKYINKFEARCINCGYCKSVCPIATTKKGETGSRSFLQLARFRNFEDPAPGESRRAEKMLRTCLGCLRCRTRCPSHASIGELLFSQKSPPIYTKKAMSMWASDYDRFEKYARFFGRLMSPAVGAALGRDLPKVRRSPRAFVDRAQKQKSGAMTSVMTVAVFGGCASAILDDNVFESMVRVLEESGFDVVIPDQCCCGLPMIGEGLYDLARDAARKNVAAFSDARYDAIVTACASCTMMLKQFGNLLGDDSAKKVSSITYDIGEFLEKFTDDRAFSKEKLEMRVAYHHPCHLAAAGVADADSCAILKRIVTDFVELPDGCCGGAGAYGILHSDLSERIFDRKAEAILEIDPDTIVTTCPSCELQFRHNLAKRGITCEVRNIVEVVDRYYSGGKR